MAPRTARVIDLTAGTAMVVTDLHGDGTAFGKYVERFRSLHAQGAAEYLILTGDLIHHSGPAEQDASLSMVLEVLSLRAEFGDRLIYLLGNHELPHIYSFTLQKGQHLFTPAFEHAMGKHRQAVVDLLCDLPFVVRTQAGVTICHAGASAVLHSAGDLETLRNFSHRHLLARARQTVGQAANIDHLRQRIAENWGMSYKDLVWLLLAVEGENDPRYDDILVGELCLGSSEMTFLWQMLFSRNELQYGIDRYPEVLERMLSQLSADGTTQHVLVSGHLDCQGGYTVVAPRHLRIASGKNAIPLESGCYLLFDVAQEVLTADGLLTGLGSVMK